MNKKTALTLSLVCICLMGGAFYFYYSWQTQEQNTANTSQKLPQKNQLAHHGHNHAHHHGHAHQAPTRAPAAIQPIDYSKYKINPNWKKISLTKIKKNLPSDYKVEVEEVGAREMLKGDMSKRLIQQVIVNIEHPTGAKSNYSAIIDSETGSIIETFNHPQFEDRRFYAVKLKADYNSLQLVPINKKQK